MQAESLLIMESFKQIVSPENAAFILAVQLLHE
jgi:hypothetical protein